MSFDRGNNPQYDPRVIHMLQDNRRWTLCGLEAVYLKSTTVLPPGTKIYQCQGCYTLSKVMTK